jgi:hypothetical protein
MEHGQDAPRSEGKSKDGGKSEGGRRSRRGRRGRGGNKGGDNKPGVKVPNSGRNVRRRRSRRRRSAAVTGLTRRRRLSRSELEDLSAYVSQLSDTLLHVLYRGLGGQPKRVPDRERLIQLSVRAVAQGNRMGNLLKSMHERERTALAILLQCGGLAHADEFHRELMLSLGGHEREWQKVMISLADKGLLAASDAQDDHFFYLVPDPLVDHMTEHLKTELGVPIFDHEDVQVRDHRPFCPPLDFSIATLCTYIDQRPPRLTQQQDIYKAHQEEMDTFFAQLWEANSELFNFHVDFLILHGLVELRGDHISVNREVVEEWLNLDPQDQRDLIFRALDRRFSYAEWILWAVHSGKGEWVPERPLSNLYRRWKRGEDWRTRFHKGVYAPTRTNERESFSFAPLVNCGMIELGEWGQEKFYRLTPRARSLLDPPEDDGFTAFYLTPSFEIMAPAGLAPLLLFRIGELSELIGCDRANTYRVTEISIERALEKSWRRDDVLDFLRDNSQTGLPENVGQTLRGWMGHQGDVEFHDAVLLSVHRSRIRKLESMRELKPFLLHRFTPGLYAVDRTKLAEINAVLGDSGFFPAQQVKHYPGSHDQVTARERLLQLVVEAREIAEDPQARAHAADTQPSELQPVPGSSVDQTRSRKKKQPPRVSPREAKMLIEEALIAGQNLEVLYLARDGKRVTSRVTPERLAITPAGDEVMVARDQNKKARRTYKLTSIERLRAIRPRK